MAIDSGLELELFISIYIYLQKTISGNGREDLIPSNAGREDHAATRISGLKK